MYSVGIDLGTTNSLVAIYRKGRAEVLPIRGHKKTPSVVGWDDKGELRVGVEAKKRALLNPETTIISNKRWMGTDKTYTIGDKTYTPVDIATLLLKDLVEGASLTLDGPITRAVITVPAYFNSLQKEETKRAAEAAGLEVLCLQPEPTAAAIAYGFQKEKNQTILVYDLGGGTFDVSLLKVTGNEFEVLALGGDTFLGGDNFDEVLVDHITKELESEMGLDLRSQDSRQLRLFNTRLKEQCETCKMELSASKRSELTIVDVLGKGDFETQVTRQRFETMIQPYLERTNRITLETLACANLSPDEISRVVCVGGSCKVPLVRQLLTDMVRTPFNAPNVDEIVAEGAAISAASFQQPDRSGQSSLPLLDISAVNITAYDLGIRLDRDQFSKIIPRNSKLPMEAQQVYTTTKDNADQTDIVVFQGNQPLCSNNTPLGGFLFKGFKRAPAGKAKIEVSFRLDGNDIRHVEARDQGSKAKNALVIESFKPEPYEPEAETARTIEDLRIGVSRVGFDDVGAILTTMKIPWKEVRDTDFCKRKKLNGFDVLFINCLAGGNAFRNRKPLAGWVADGGFLYASDCARSHLNSAFPKLFVIKRNSHFQGSVNTTIINKEFSQVLGKTQMQINFNTVSYYCKKVNHPQGEVYLTGNYNGHQEPILVGAPHGEGHIIFTAFHNYGSATSAERELLKYLILKPLALATKTPLAELQIPS